LASTNEGTILQIKIKDNGENITLYIFPLINIILKDGNLFFQFIIFAFKFLPKKILNYQKLFIS
jgi:hypothetical protein